jgi:L-arabinose 1-dehydrogenase [NAD(P)+]
MSGVVGLTRFVITTLPIRIGAGVAPLSPEFMRSRSQVDSVCAIAITGSEGAVGRHAVAAFEGERLTRFTHPGDDGRQLDVTDRAAFVSALSGQDVLVHLAWGAASPEAWSDGHESNLRGAYNAYEAARENDLDRVVFPSSAHVTGMYNRDTPEEMESLSADPNRAVSPGDPPRPDSYYGVVKVACEAMGRYYADRYDLEVVVLRIGWLLTRSELQRVCSGAPERARFARATWLSPRDCRAVLRAAALEPLADRYLIAHAISANDSRYLTLVETMRQLDYHPQDDAADVVET